jgi:hypothetical protein
MVWPIIIGGRKSPGKRGLAEWLSSHPQQGVHLRMAWEGSQTECAVERVLTKSKTIVILRSGATKNLLFAGAKRKQISRSARNDKI